MTVRWLACKQRIVRPSFGGQDAVSGMWCGARFTTYEDFEQRKLMAGVDKFIQEIKQSGKQ